MTVRTAVTVQPGTAPIEVSAPVRVTSADIRAALRDRYAPPECAIAFEVAQGTGLDARRHLDAVAMELWPSRGHALHGIEIKVTRGDWRREKSDPEKAEEIARYCDFFWIAAPKGVVPLDELPSAWGLLEYSADGRGPRLKSTVKAQRTKARPAGREFLAALFRAATRPADPEVLSAALRDRRRQLEEDFQTRLDSALQRLAGRQDADAENWRRLTRCLEEAAGDAHLRCDDQDTMRAIVAVHRCGAANTFRGLGAMAAVLERSAKELREGMKVLEIDPDVPYGKKRRTSTP